MTISQTFLISLELDSFFWSAGQVLGSTIKIDELFSS